MQTSSEMSPFKKGKAIIFNVENDREDSENDLFELQRTLESLNVDVTPKRINLNIDVIKNLTEEKKEEELLKIKDETKEDIISELNRPNYAEYDYVIVAFFAHGLDDEQIQIGSFRFALQKLLVSPLIKNPSLDNKLKWFILQSCAGKYEGAKTDGKSSEKYILKSFATQEGCLAYRMKYPESKDSFAFFIRRLCENLTQHASSEDIMYILNKTRESVEEECIEGAEGRIIRQQPRDFGNLGETRKFYFTRGIVENAE